MAPKKKSTKVEKTPPKPNPKQKKQPSTNANKKAESDKGTVPFISPTESEGPPVPRPRYVPSIEEWLRAALRSRAPSAAGKEGGRRLPIGFPENHNMCYRNAALSLLMNIAPFTAYLEHYSAGRHQRGSHREDGVLNHLATMASAYWSAGSDKSRRARLPIVIENLWSHLRSLGDGDSDGHGQLVHTVPWGPHLDEEQNETQQDAGEFLENMLTNADAQLLDSGNDQKEYNSMVEANFQIRTACAGNCAQKRRRRRQLDATRLWTVNIDQSKGSTKGTLEDCIRATMTNEVDLTCDRCKSMQDQNGMGRIWQRLRDAPEILLIRISRFEWSKKMGKMHKLGNRVHVPETLDMSPYLEESDQKAGVQARYQLCGAVTHAGTMERGHYVSHVRGPDEQWYRLEDQYATASGLETLNNDPQKFQRFKFTPFVLAYTRVHEEGSEEEDFEILSSPPDSFNKGRKSPDHVPISPSPPPHDSHHPLAVSPALPATDPLAAAVSTPEEPSLRLVFKIAGNSFASVYRPESSSHGFTFAPTLPQTVALRMAVVDKHDKIWLRTEDDPATTFNLVPTPIAAAAAAAAAATANHVEPSIIGRRQTDTTHSLNGHGENQKKVEEEEEERVEKKKTKRTTLPFFTPFPSSHDAGAGAGAGPGNNRSPLSPRRRHRSESQSVSDPRHKSKTAEPAKKARLEGVNAVLVISDD